MGTDIHTVWQTMVNGEWQDVEHKYDEGRDYAVFAWLGNVRNGFGFAGVKTFDPIEPLQIGRGLPDDFYVNDDLEHNGKWLGDHSHGWLTGDEILNAEIPKIKDQGYISIKSFKEWDKVSPPSYWSAFVDGGGVVRATPETITPETTHVLVSWEWSLEDIAKDFLAEVKRLTDIHGEIRIVFGFDS